MVLAERLHSIPFRTRKLRAPAPMVLCLKAWESRTLPGLLNVKRESLARNTSYNIRFRMYEEMKSIINIVMKIKIIIDDTLGYSNILKEDCNS